MKSTSVKLFEQETKFETNSNGNDNIDHFNEQFTINFSYNNKFSRETPSYAI